MRQTKKAVRKAVEAREKAKAKKAARTKRVVAQEGNSSGDQKAPAPVTVEGTDCVPNESGILVPKRRSEFPRPPTHLFKYVSPSRIWAMLADGLVYFASPLSFNDPYDARILYAKNPEDMEKKMREFGASREYGDVPGSPKNKKEWENRIADMRANHGPIVEGMEEQHLRKTNLGIFCLSCKCTSFPMWAHYAENHEGGCLVFNLSACEENAHPESGNGCFPFSIVRPVEYQDERPVYDRKSPEALFQHFLTKSKEWAYESEWRALMPDHRAPRSRPLPSSFQGVGSYPHNGTLVGVVLGDRMPQTMRWLIHRMAEDRNLAVWQASTRVGEYGLDIEPCNARAQKENLRADEAG